MNNKTLSALAGAFACAAAFSTSAETIFEAKFEPGFPGWTLDAIGPSKGILAEVKSYKGVDNVAFITKNPKQKNGSNFEIRSGRFPVRAGANLAVLTRLASSLRDEKTKKDLRSASGYFRSYVSGVRWYDATGREAFGVWGFGYETPPNGEWGWSISSTTVPEGAVEACVSFGFDSPNLSTNDFFALATAKVELSNRVTEGRATLRDDGVVLVDGKPFFPIGIYAVHACPSNGNSLARAVSDLKGIGLNLLHLTNTGNTKECDELLSLADRNDMKVFLHPVNAVFDKTSENFVTQSRIPDLLCHKSVLSWYLADDTASHVGPEVVALRHRMVKAQDPDHLTLQADGVHMGWTNCRYDTYVHSTDVFLPEIYPMYKKTPNHYEVSEVVHDMEACRDAIRKAGSPVKSIWPIIQMFDGWGWKRFPSETELRCMSWKGIIHGGNGITWYVYHSRSGRGRGVVDGHWDEYARVTREISALQDDLVQRDAAEQPKITIVSGPQRDAYDFPSVTARLKTGEKPLLMTANATTNEVVASISVPEGFSFAEVLGEDRIVLVRKGAIQDTFAPHGVHLYRLVKTGLDRTRFNVGTYRFGDKIPGFRTEQHVKELKEAGVDFIASMRPGSDAAAFYRTMDLFAKYGVGAIPEGGDAIGASCPVKSFGRVKENKPLDPARYQKAAAKFRPHPAIWGIDVGDEPHGMDLPNVGKAVEICHRLFPVPFLYVNLFPSYARLATNTTDIVNSQLGSLSYKDYIEDYCRYVPLDYISFDIYFYSQSAPRGVGTFFNNLKIAADACVNHGKSLWLVGQCNTWHGKVPLAENRMRYQAYAGLAFGAEVMTWACWTPGWWTNNVYNLDGKRTVAYDRVKAVNAELHLLGDACMKYRRTATHFVGYTGGYTPYLQGCDAVSEEKVSTGWFRDIAAEDGAPILVTEYMSRDGKGSQAIYVMASEDPYDENEKTRTIRFRSLRRGVQALGGKGPLDVTRTDNGFFTISLRSNRAALIWTKD